MKITLPKDITPIVEEVWYLIQNPNFQRIVARLRKKYNIPQEGLKIRFQDWMCDIPQAEIQNRLDEFYEAMERYDRFKIDIHKLTSKCRMGTSQFNFDLWMSLNNYVLTNKLEARDKVMAKPYPNLGFKNRDNMIRITIDVYSDSTEKQAAWVLHGYWKQIEKEQLRIRQGKLLSKSNFPINVGLWELSRSVKDPKKVTTIMAKRLRNFNKDWWDVRKLLENMDERIRLSYKPERVS